MFVTLLRIAIDRQRDRDMNRANRHREVVRDRQIDRYIYIEREKLAVFPNLQAL